MLYIHLNYVGLYACVMKSFSKRGTYYYSLSQPQRSRDQTCSCIKRTLLHLPFLSEIGKKTQLKGVVHLTTHDQAWHHVSFFISGYAGSNWRHDVSAPSPNRQWVGFCVEDPFVQRQYLSEGRVLILEHTLSSLWLVVVPVSA